MSTGEHIEADYTLSSCAVFATAIRVLYAVMPAYLHAEAHGTGVDWNWNWDDNRPDVIYIERGELEKFQAIEDEGEDVTPIKVLHRSAKALALSYPCEEAAQLVSFLFPNYKSKGTRKSDAGEEAKGPYEYPPCGGENCALNYVLNQMIRLGRLGSGT